MVCIVWILLCRPKKCLHNRLINHLNILIIKEEPVVVTLDQTHIVSMIRSTAHMHYHSKQRVLRFRPRGIICGITKLEFQREYHPVRKLLIPAQLLNVLEALEMKCQNAWWWLYLHSLLCLLQTGRRIPDDIRKGPPDWENWVGFKEFIHNLRHAHNTLSLLSGAPAERKNYTIRPDIIHKGWWYTFQASFNSASMWSTHLQHLSQKNLSSAFRVSVELKLRRQLVIELFCSISRLRSKNVSSRAVIVSHRKHLVSFVNVPCKVRQHLWTCG